MMEIATAASASGAAVVVNPTISGMREELQKYLQETFGVHKPYATNNINCDYSIGGQVHIRFELGGELPNGTKERVEQSVQRALTIFEETFEMPDNEIWVLIYEYQRESLFGGIANYLRKQFLAAVFAEFYSQLEMVTNASFDTQEVRIIIGKVKVKEINIINILTAIANTEMGFEPSLDERIFFIDSRDNRLFHMYDDRGCFVESNTADNIRDLYLKRNEWIVNYHRAEIDGYFE